MMQTPLKWRMTIIVLVVLFAAISVAPNFMKVPKDSIFSDKTIVYGLDIQGGLHLVMGVDVNDVVKEQYTRTAISLKDTLKTQENIETTSVSRVDDEAKSHIAITVTNPADTERVSNYIEENWTNYLVLGIEGNTVSIQQNDLAIDDLKKRTIEQAIETIRNRVDEFGVSEPSITAQGDDRILVQLPGIEDASQAKEIIYRTARLEFMLVSKESEAEQLAGFIKEAETAGNYSSQTLKYPEYIKKLNEDLKDKIPANNVILFSTAENTDDIKVGKMPYLLEKVGIGGDDLRDAYVNMDQYGKPQVAFSFNPDGARKFGDLTGKNKGRQLAVVLDNIVKSAPNIRSKITDSGVIELGSTQGYEESMKEAKMISMVLRAGALPTRLEQLEERTVGPTLGADSIAKGKFAIIIGGLLVIAFMLFWYKSFGLLADLALALNMFLILAVLTSLEATLTLPGIAGIALTIGMAVDANVIIFERIKEELKRGMSFGVAVHEGYSKGFSAIFDANVTTAATSIILMYFGTGPVRGFAVTLLIGIVTSMFTAIFVTRTVLDILIIRMKKEKLAI